MAETLKGRYVKANSLVNAAYRLNVSEQRILIIALMQADARNITDQIFYPVKVEDMMLYTNKDRKLTYEIMKKAAASLEDRRLFFYQTPEGKPRKLIRARWVQSSAFEADTSSIYLKFSHDVLPYITRLTKRFTIVHMIGNAEHHLLSLTSNFSYRLLEMMCQWIDRGWFEIEPDVLKRTFALTTQYARFAELKRRVIDIAVNEINEKTPWVVNCECETQGKGGKVVNLKFVFVVPAEIVKARKKQKNETAITEKEIKKHAQPGETYAQVRDRLIKRKKEIKKLQQELELA